MRHTRRWQKFRDLATLILLPLLVALILIGSAFRIAENNRLAEIDRRDAQQDRQEILQITCTAAHSDRLVLQTLADLERRLGVPIDFELPEVPEECEELHLSP